MTVAPPRLQNVSIAKLALNQRLRSQQNLIENLSRHVGQTKATAVVLISESLVLETEQVENRGVDVIDMNLVDGGRIAYFIRLTVADASFDSSAGHPEREAVGIVIATGRLAGLGNWQAAEFSAPDDERLVQQTPLLQVGQ